MLYTAGICFEGKCEEYKLGEPTDRAGSESFNGQDYVLTVGTIVSHDKAAVVISADMDEPKPHYVYLKAEYVTGTPFSFNGPETKHVIMRQSPHDPTNHHIDMPKQAVPMAAVDKGNETTVMFCDNPAVYDNYCTQEFNAEEKYVLLASSDSGVNTHDGGIRFEPHYHSRSIPFEVHIFNTPSCNLKAFRIKLFTKIAEAFGEGNSLFYSIMFSSNYMHYRKNETGYSDCWLVPGIDYANKQYTRDAFWQSMILPFDTEKQIFDAVYPERYRYAENALLYVIWAKRIIEKGGRINYERLDDAVSFIEKNTLDNRYLVKGTNGKPTFRSWYDIVAFEDNDPITYNQGLLVVALMVLKELDINTSIDPEEALEHYRAAFDDENGFYMLSAKKKFYAADALIGDLMSIMLFGKALLPDDRVKRHYDFMTKTARTDYGFKVTCRKDGSYLTKEDHLIPGFEEEFFERSTPGAYAWGGSYYLYDMLCLIPCYLHGAKGCLDVMIERTLLELRTGGTTHEHINTLTGEPGKANQGWNAAVIGIWLTLTEKGKTDKRFINEINNAMEDIC